MSLPRILRSTQTHWKQWQAPAIGLAVGLTYGIISQQVDFEAVHAPKAFIWISNVVSVLLEGVWGIFAGFAFNYIRSQARINRALSTENAKLQRHFFTQILSAHILHEIRTPMHNLTLLLENWQQELTPEDASIFQRNLSRLQTITTQLSRWTSLDDEIDSREPVLLGPWLNEFIVDKVRPQLNQTDIGFEQHIEQVVVHMHPLLLEQCFTTLFNNAVEAVLRNNGPRLIRLNATLSSNREGYVTIRLQNTGELYPDAVLAGQGREPFDSQHGLGLGLVLVWRSLELVGGSMRLSNVAHQAHTELSIPGRPA